MENEVVGKAEMHLVRANYLRVNNYDSRIETIRDLKTYQFTEKILQDVANLKVNTVKDRHVVNDIITYLTNAHRHLQNNILNSSEKVESSLLLEIVDDVLNNVDEFISHFENVLNSLEKEENLPEHPTKNYVDEFYNTFKKEYASSKNIVKLLKGGFWSNFFNKKHNLLESSNTITQHIRVFRQDRDILKKQNPDEKDAPRIKLLAERFLKREDYDYKILFSNLKRVYIHLSQLYSIVYVLRKISEDEAKIIMKWNNHHLH